MLFFVKLCFSRWVSFLVNKTRIQKCILKIYTYYPYFQGTPTLPPNPNLSPVSQQNTTEGIPAKLLSREAESVSWQKKQETLPDCSVVRESVSWTAESVLSDRTSPEGGRKVGGSDRTYRRGRGSPGGRIAGRGIVGIWRMEISGEYTESHFYWKNEI